MLIRQAELDAIRSGDLDLAFRRWDRPRVRTGSRMRTPIGLVEATSVEQVTLESITDAEARRAVPALGVTSCPNWPVTPSARSSASG